MKGRKAPWGTATLAASILASCDGSQGVQTTHHGLDLAGSFVDLDRVEEAFDLQRDGDSVVTGTLTPDLALGAGSLSTFDGGAAIELPGHLFALHAADTGPESLVLTVPRGKDLGTLRPLVEGNYTWVRLREAGGMGDDWGFLRIEGDRFFLQSRGADDADIDSLVYGVNILDSATADHEGTVSWSKDDPQVVVLESAGGDRWGGVVDPGWSFILQAPDGDGILLAIWCPQSHAQLTTWDGPHDGLEFRVGESGFQSPGGVAFDFFSREGTVTRTDTSGSARAWNLGNRIPVFPVGNLAHWDFTAQPEDPVPSERFFVLHWDGVTAWFSTTLSGPGGPGQATELLSFGVGVQP